VPKLLANYTLTLTEVADGIHDHGHYKNRRASALVVATNLSITNQAGHPLQDNKVDIVDTPASAGQPWTFTWHIQGTPKNVNKMVNVFNAFEFVSASAVPASIRKKPKKNDVVRFLASTAKRRRSAGLGITEIPIRARQTPMHQF
jgi:hypothetical protein